MKLEVSAALCTGQGRCYSIAPDLLHYDDEGYVSVRGQTIDVPAHLADAARNAVLACPEGAITMT